jgi:DNA repair protein RadD
MTRWTDPDKMKAGRSAEHNRDLDQLGIGPHSPRPAPKPETPPAPLWRPQRFHAEWAKPRPPMEPCLHNLYDYQEGALTAIRASLAAGNLRPMVMSPTGSGKTVIAEHAIAMQLLGETLVRIQVEGKGRVAFVVPRLELIRQTIDRFRSVGLTDIGVVQGDHPLRNPHARIQICSAQTLSRRELPDVDLVIVDEAHLMHKSIFRWMKDKPDLPFIGLSATPWAQGLGKYYDDLIIVTTTQELIDKKRLCDFKAYSHGLEANLSSVDTVAGEFHQQQLGAVMDDAVLVGDVVSTWQEKGENRPTFLFAVNCDHARHLYERFIEAGVGAAYMDGDTLPDERRDIFARFRAGAVKVICSVGVLTTGVDEDVRCIIDAQPTRSQILHVQKIGRGLRTAPGKDFLLVLDHAGNHLRLGRVTDIFHGKLHDGTPKAEAERKAEKGEPLPKLCPECKAVISKRDETCPQCGHRFTAYTKIRHQDGELVLLGSGEQGRIGPTELERQTFYRECLGHGRDKGWKPGAAYYQFPGKYGKDAKPKREWQQLEPLTPSLATINEINRQWRARESHQGLHSRSDQRLGQEPGRARTWLTTLCRTTDPSAKRCLRRGSTARNIGPCS